MNPIESNMGLAKVQYPRIILNHPRYYVLYGFGVIIPIVLALHLKSPAYIVLMVPFLTLLIGYVIRIKGLFYNCDVNIAKLLSRKQRLYAVALNLAGKDMPPVLAVKIARGRVPNTGTYKYSDGDYFPVTCYPNYKKSPEDMDNVFTIPYTSATNYNDSLKFQHEHIETQVEAFEKCLSQISTPYRPGLYFVN